MGVSLPSPPVRASKMHGYQADLYRANINVHPMAIWAIIEIFREKLLLSRVRAELQVANLTGMGFRDKTERLLSLPLLQSIYAELLRLRVELQSVFYSEHEEIQINEWRFPRKSVVIAPIGSAHRDPNFWNSRDGAQPLHKFWADRFLVYPNDPQSGPQKPLLKFLTDSGIILTGPSQNLWDQAWQIHTCHLASASEFALADSLPNERFWASALRWSMNSISRCSGKSRIPEWIRHTTG